jgi:hypothetical protein
VDKLVE